MSALEVHRRRLSGGVERYAEKIVRDVWVNRIVEQNASVLVLRIKSDAHKNQTGQHSLGVSRAGFVGAEQAVQIGRRKLALMMRKVKSGCRVLVPRLRVAKDRKASRAIK